MPTLAELDDLPHAEPVPSPFEKASRLLERAVDTGCVEPEVIYLLAMAYKRQGKRAEARHALRRIAQPDANVYLQLGILALGDQPLAQAEQEFLRAQDLDPNSYEAAYNLLLTRWSLAQFDTCLAQLPRTLELARTEEERRFLTQLGALLYHRPRRSEGNRTSSEVPSADVVPIPLSVLQDVTPGEEERLLRLVGSVGDLDGILALFKTLRASRPDSAAVQAAFVEAVLAKGKALLDRCEWVTAEQLLAALARDKSLLSSAPRATQAAFLNLLGCCACLNQDKEGGLRYFAAALKIAPTDPCLHQNVALSWEWQGNLVKADPHWNRFLDLLHDHWPTPPGWNGYHEHLAFEVLNRLAARYSEAENWSGALPYVERALRLRPQDTDVLERLFHLYHHLKRTKDARKTLVRLRELRPSEPQLELYELDLVEINTLGDIDRVLTETERICQRFPNDARVEERAVTLVTNVFPWINNRCEQLTEQLHRVRDQLRHLPNYQVNWSAVRDVMRDLVREFQKLRKIGHKCLALVHSDEQRRVVRELADQIDRRINDCRRLEE